MNLNDITLLTVSFNNNLLTGLMLKSFFKQVNDFDSSNVIIIDNGTKIPVDDKLKQCFTVIDNYNHKLIPNEFQASRNHCVAIDYALKNCVKTKWVLLADNDVLFRKTTKTFLEEFDDTKYDCAAEIGWDMTPPNRLYPYFCLINVEKFNMEKQNYFDRNRIISFAMQNDPKTYNIKFNKMDTGYSFYEDIKGKWNILEIKFNDYISHLKDASNPRRNKTAWLVENKTLFT